MVEPVQPERLTGTQDTDIGAQAAWEEAFVSFESPEQERRKFIRRLKGLGVDRWDKELRVLELFCGGGSGLSAWEQMGFENIEGMDISAGLVNSYSGDAKCTVGDARNLPFADGTFDVVCVQGGLHHLHLMDDFDRTLGEVHRVLVKGGRFIVVEPWQTPFLRFVHFMMGIGLVRKLSKRVDTYATLCALERRTFEPWLKESDAIIKRLQFYSDVLTLRIRWGKLMFVGIRKEHVA